MDPRRFTDDELAAACERAARAEIFAINQLEFMVMRTTEPATSARLIAEIKEQAAMLAEAGRRLRQDEERSAA